MFSVLIADDEAQVFEGMKHILDWKALGFDTPHFAADGKDALRMLRHVGYHLLITDLRMPEMHGLELIKRVAAVSPGTRIVILSGFNEFDYAQQAIEYGVRSYMLKPVARTKLRETVERIKAELDEERTQRAGRVKAYDAYFRSREDAADADGEAAAEPEAAREEPAELFHRLLEYIDAHYAEELNLKEIAKRFFLNTAYLGQFFRKRAGEPFHDYLNRKRIEEFKRLAALKKLSVGELIETVGYSNPEYFYKLFRKYEGQTVAQYRQTLD